MDVVTHIQYIWINEGRMDGVEEGSRQVLLYRLL